MWQPNQKNRTQISWIRVSLGGNSGNFLIKVVLRHIESLGICYSIWNNQLWMNIDFEHVFFPRIRFIMSICCVDYFPADLYKSWEQVIVRVSRRFFSRWRWVTRNRTKRWKSSYIRSIREISLSPHSALSFEQNSTHNLLAQR